MSSNITFVTHLRYDNPDRLRNLQTILNYYSLNFPRSKFILVEDDKEHNKNFDNIVWPKKRTQFYFISNDGYYYRTRALNYGILKATTPVVVSLDTDCIAPVESINKCTEALLNNATIAWPYNGFFIDTSHLLHEHFIKNDFGFSSLKEQLPPVPTLQLSHSYAEDNFSIRCTNTVHQSVGGIVMFNRERFLEIGGYNEKFIAWGAEDNELCTRVKTLEHKSFRDEDIDSVCFHLFHNNAIRNNHPYYQSNFDEAALTGGMTKEELLCYISTWKHLK
jgi:predicted glycosyltransferase involved in capsule biosynthesis